jgi:predicted DNA-binding protein
LQSGFQVNRDYHRNGENANLVVELEPELAARLEQLAKETGRSTSYYAELAIMEFLEDREDYLTGIAALERTEPRISLEQLERELLTANCT